MTKPPTMPDIRILIRSISEEWEDLLLGAYTDPERAETDRLRYLAAIGVQDPWQERRDDGAMTAAWKTQSKSPPSPITATLPPKRCTSSCFTKNASAKPPKPCSLRPLQNPPKSP